MNGFDGGLRITGLAGMASTTVVAVAECGCETDLVGLLLDTPTAYDVAAQLVEAVAQPDDLGARHLVCFLRAKASDAEPGAGDPT